MVILAAAGVGAAGYGLYKGGEAGIQKGKECHRDFQNEKKRASQRSSLREKTKARSSRIAEIVQMKEQQQGGSTSRFGFGTATASTAATGTPRASFAERQLAEKEASSGVNDRYRAVTEKLRSGRREEQKKESFNKNKLSSLNPFKKK